MKNIKWGLLSTARINRRVIPAIRLSKRGTLNAVASRDKQKAEAYAREWEIPVTFGSYEEMLASDEVDAVYVSLPNHLHAEWTVKALLAGKHVLCEKPFALTVEEVDRMIAAKEKSGCALMEAFMYRHHPQTLILQDWISNGKLGDITLVRSYFSFNMSNREGNVRLVPEYGGGSLWDVGIYPISFSQMVMGGHVPEWVAASQQIGPSGVDEVFAGMMNYSGSRAAQIGCAFRTPYNTFTDVIGTQGRLTLTRPFNSMDTSEREMIFIPIEGKSQEIKVPAQELYLGEIENMHDAILEGKPTRVTLAESRNHIATAQALYESARTGKMVSLSSVG